MEVETTENPYQEPQNKQKQRSTGQLVNPIRFLRRNNDIIEYQSIAHSSFIHRNTSTTLLCHRNP